MVITWRADRPPACDDPDHGPLAAAALSGLDAAVVMLEHLRDEHGKDVDRALASVTARRDAQAAA